MKILRSTIQSTHCACLCALLTLSIVHCPLSIAQTTAQTTAKQCFLSIPDTLMPLLTEVNRADFVDFLESNMRAEVTNRLQGKSEMTALTSDYIHIRMTASSTWQMKVLALTDTTAVVCTVSTVCGPVCDSHVRFYTTDWQPLPAPLYLPARPAIDDCIAPLPTDSVASPAYLEARSQANITLLRADLSPDEPTLTLTLTTPDYMSASAADLIRPQLLPPLVYTWSDGRFQ